MTERDIADKRVAFIGQASNIICYFGKLSSVVKQHLLNSYCTSLFGCELWRLDDSSINTLSVAWRRAIERVDLYRLQHLRICCLYFAILSLSTMKYAAALYLLLVVACHTNRY
jgi:hypothetical protein